MRHIVNGFNDWYKAQVPAGDPLLDYFNKVRNEILKESKLPKLSTAVELSAPHSCHDERKTAVANSHSRAPQTASELGASRSALTIAPAADRA
jgi:hypothetical protein